MSLFSSTVSLSRYRVQGKLSISPIELVEEGLKKNTITDIDNESMDTAIGWTSLQSPYSPDYSSSSFLIGTTFAFSLRIDKKSIPSKIIQMLCAVEEDKRLRESGEESLSKGERKQIKETVIDILNIRIPPTPNIYDLLWDNEAQTLSFFSTHKGANEELETLFFKSFALRLIRIFPYTAIELTHELTDIEKDKVAQLTPETFKE